MRQHDQQGTPFKQNISELWDAIRGRPRSDGRGWFNGVTHEGLNVLVELTRAHPKAVALLTLALTTILIEWALTGSFL